MVVYNTGGIVTSFVERTYKNSQARLRKEVGTMRCLRMILISAFLALLIALSGCCGKCRKNTEMPETEAERVAWRSTGTGYYHPEIDY
jgi:hypothetical protein